MYAGKVARGKALPNRLANPGEKLSTTDLRVMKKPEMLLMMYPIFLSS
jgi:hypothetical protein